MVAKRVKIERPALAAARHREHLAAAHDRQALRGAIEYQGDFAKEYVALGRAQVAPRAKA
jgi:hypothetical protein